VYGYPKERAAKIAVGMIRRYLAERSGKDELLIILCAFAAADAKIYERVLAEAEQAEE
jgi:O-acetyl-ADP-ribose deacetylase (regulator of RNase III)